jgi:hypothetical protein
MSNPASEYPAEDLRKLSDSAAIALATAVIEKGLGAATHHPEAGSLLRGLLDELWSWQLAEKTQGQENLSVKEAKAFPSAKLYHGYQARLLELADQYRDQGKVYHLIGATIAALGFILWVMDGLERRMNPGKPFVLGSELMEVDWDTLVAALSTAVKASDDPEEVFTWQKAALARLAKDHPASAQAASAPRPVPRDSFVEELALPARGVRSEPPASTPTPPPPAQRYEAEDLQEKFTEYAAIALATAVIHRLLSAGAEHPELQGPLQKLLDALWTWQQEEKPQGTIDMREEVARTLPSFRFYSKAEELRRLRERYPQQSKVSTLLSSVADALVFISWTMDGIERRMNPGKPFVIGDEADERQWGALADALNGAAEASMDPGQERAWQAKTLQRLAREHPGDPDGGTLGKPLSRDDFS